MTVGKGHHDKGPTGGVKTPSILDLIGGSGEGSLGGRSGVSTAPAVGGIIGGALGAALGEECGCIPEGSFLDASGWTPISEVQPEETSRSDGGRPLTPRASDPLGSTARGAFGQGRETVMRCGSSQSGTGANLFSFGLPTHGSGSKGAFLGSSLFQRWKHQPTAIEAVEAVEAVEALQAGADFRTTAGSAAGGGKMSSITLRGLARPGLTSSSTAYTCVGTGQRRRFASALITSAARVSATPAYPSQGASSTLIKQLPAARWQNSVSGEEAKEGQHRFDFQSSSSARSGNGPESLHLRRKETLMAESTFGSGEFRVARSNVSPSAVGAGGVRQKLREAHQGCEEDSKIVRHLEGRGEDGTVRHLLLELIGGPPREGDSLSLPSHQTGSRSGSGGRRASA